jgi:RimJ/RimL family protein N-acetyltransferase
VDTACAVRELQEIGYQFQPGYVENLLTVEADRLKQLMEKREDKRLNEIYNDWQDDRFYFIAGYTSGGAPYGVTWEEMGMEPYGGLYDDDGDEVISSYRHYEFLSQREKDAVNHRLREDFSQYVAASRRLPSKGKQQHLIEQVFESCERGPLLYTKDFNTTYRKIVRKRENAFIREGVLPKRFTPTEVKRYLAQSVMLESDRLLFRKLTPDDFDGLAEMLRDPDVMYAWEHTFTDEEINKWIAKQAERYKNHIVGYFAAVNKATGELIGQMGLIWSDIGELRALEIGYMLKREHWGKGYATEGAAALAEYAFSEIGVNRVYTSIRPENIRSVRVAERIGMSAGDSFIKLYDGKNMEHTIYYLDRSAAPEGAVNRK